MDAATLQGIMCRRNIELIFLNACETGQGGKADFNRGVSPSLLQAGVPAIRPKSSARRAPCRPRRRGPNRAPRESAAGLANTRRPAELGVDRIIAFTNLPMRDARTLNLFAWSNVDGGASIFSTAGYLAEIVPPALTIERMIANASVAFLSGLVEHEKGVRDCPMYYNEERDVASIAGPLQFCDRCRRQLTPAARETLGKLLGVLLTWPEATSS